jgi:hypothetical protein
MCRYASMLKCKCMQARMRMCMQTRMRLRTYKCTCVCDIVLSLLYSTHTHTADTHGEHTQLTLTAKTHHDQFLAHACAPLSNPNPPTSAEDNERELLDLSDQVRVYPYVCVSVCACAPLCVFVCVLYHVCVGACTVYLTECQHGAMGLLTLYNLNGYLLSLWCRLSRVPTLAPIGDAGFWPGAGTVSAQSSNQGTSVCVPLYCSCAYVNAICCVCACATTV